MPNPNIPLIFLLLKFVVKKKENGFFPFQLFL